MVVHPRRFPDIRIALSEGGTGWIPYFMDRADRTYDMHHLWTGQDFDNLLPSEVFRRNFLTCFINDPVGVVLRHEIGIDNICWEMDYPHSDSTWPNAPELLAETLTGVPDDEVDKRPSQRHFLVPVRPVRPSGRADCTVERCEPRCRPRHLGAVHGTRAATRQRPRPGRVHLPEQGRQPLRQRPN